MLTRTIDRLVIITALTALAAMAALAEMAAAADILKWTGCGIAKEAFMAEAVNAYKKKTGVLIGISGGGATKGIRAANSGAAHMGGNCRPSLADKFPTEEGDVYLTVVAWDALVPIVHQDNPVDSLTGEQLKQILLGQITNWQDLGGPDRKILVVAREGKSSGVGYMVRKVIFGNTEVDYAADALLLKSSGPVENKVKSDVSAIAVTGISSARKRVENHESLKVLAVDGNQATVANIASGAYPTFRPLYLSTKGQPSGPVKDFLDWLTAAEGQKIVEAVGTVSMRQAVGLKTKFKHWEDTGRVVNFAAMP